MSMETKAIVLPKVTAQIVKYTLLTTSFLIPFLISCPQLLTGTIVNSLLYLYVSQAYSKKTLSLIILPSIGALLNGVVFSTFTPFLLYFLPFIWISNYILVQSFQRVVKQSSFILAVFVSSLLKSLFLFCIAFIFTSTKIVPSIFLQAMGVFQFATAALGGFIAFGVYTIISKKYDRR